jgi:hypothetical protein
MQRGLQAEVIEELRIGYAPGRCLRAWLTSLGYPLAVLQQAGLVNAEGHDTYSHRIVFPLEGNLYGRSIGAAVPHRFLPGSKGGLYAWDKVRHYPEIISGGRPVRLGRALASRIPQRHLRSRDSLECAAVPPVES